jgi:hypothetical protein
VPLPTATNVTGDLRERLAQVKAQIAKKQGKADRRSASFQALLKEQTELQVRLQAMEKEDLESEESFQEVPKVAR